MIRTLFVAIAFLFAAPALAQTYPPLTGRVVDAADLLNPAQEAQLTQKLVALEAATHRQLVVATIPNLEGHDIAEYGVGLGRAWQIGQRGANNGVLLVVAPNERRVTIQVHFLHMHPVKKVKPGIGSIQVLNDFLYYRSCRASIT